MDLPGSGGPPGPWKERKAWWMTEEDIDSNPPEDIPVENVPPEETTPSPDFGDYREERPIPWLLLIIFCILMLLGIIRG